MKRTSSRDRVEVGESSLAIPFHVAFQSLSDPQLLRDYPLDVFPNWNINAGEPYYVKVYCRCEGLLIDLQLPI